MSTMFESIVGMIAADKKDVLERLKKTTDELSINNASLGNATQHIEALTAELSALKAEKESWGNEFNAVIIVNDRLTQCKAEHEETKHTMWLAHTDSEMGLIKERDKATQEAMEYREVLIGFSGRDGYDKVNSVLEKWSKGK